MSKLVVSQINWSYANVLFPAGFDDQEVLNKDPMVWRDCPSLWESEEYQMILNISLSYG
jgi:hypothetical protein